MPQSKPYLRKPLLDAAIDIIFSREVVFRGLFGIIFMLGILHLMGFWFGDVSWQLERTFNLDRESNVPTWFSSFLLILASLSCMRNSQIDVNNVNKRYWATFCLMFLYLSLDEVAMLHENMESIAKNIFYPEVVRSGFSSASWFIYLSPVIIIAVVYFSLGIHRVLATFPHERRLIYLGGLLFIFGAIIVEMMINHALLQNSATLMRFEQLVEESLEMFGVLFMLRGIFLYGDAKKMKGKVSLCRV